MNIGFHTIRRIKDIEARANELGFVFDKVTGMRADDNLLSLRPRNTFLPLYSRDAELVIGDLARIEAFLSGIEWARDYDRMLKISDSSSRDKAEQKIWNRKLLKTIKDPEDASM